MVAPIGPLTVGHPFCVCVYLGGDPYMKRMCPPMSQDISLEYTDDHTRLVTQIHEMPNPTMSTRKSRRKRTREVLAQDKALENVGKRVPPRGIRRTRLNAIEVRVVVFTGFLF